MAIHTNPPLPRPEGGPWSIRDASRHLGVSERHLARMIALKSISSFQIGRRRFIADAELRRLASGS